MTHRDEAADRQDPVTLLAQVLESDLLGRYGPMIGHDDLRQALGYPSMDAFRQALSRRHLPVTVFALPHRRGKFALSKDVAHWLAAQRGNAPAHAQVNRTVNHTPLELGRASGSTPSSAHRDPAHGGQQRTRASSEKETTQT